MRLPKKILIAYVQFPPIAFELKEAFEKQGIEVRLFLASDIPVSYFHTLFCKRFTRWAWSLRLLEKGKVLFPNHPKRWENEAAEALYQSYEEFDPDMLLFIHDPSYGGYGSRVLKKILVPKIGWYVEPFADLVRLKESSRFFDLYNSFHIKALDQLSNEGVRTGYLCHAVNPKHFYPLPDAQPAFDLCFVGNYSPWRDEVVKAALGITKNIALYGPGWLKKGRSKIGRQELIAIHKGEKIFGEELNHLFNTSKVVLSASRIRNSSGLNMRFFEVLAAGACFLTDAPPELERHFIRDKHLVTFDTLEDLPIKLKKLLDDSVMMGNIGKAGHEQVMAHHTYEHLAQEFLSQYDSLAAQAD
jgi:glycosyltransferase involved in cell wall biosynthesis